MNGKSKAYWVVTVVFALAVIGSGMANALGAEEVIKGITGLGYPAYFPAIIGVWKVLGGLAVLAPGLGRLKEWAYAGMAFVFSGAAVSHIAAGDPITAAVPPLVLLGLAVTSYVLRPEERRI